MAQNALNQSDCRIWLSTSLEGVNEYVIFLHGDNHQGKVESETTFFVGCHLLCLSSNQTAELFAHRYLWKELIDILVFCIKLVTMGKYRRLTLLVE